MKELNVHQCVRQIFNVCVHDWFGICKEGYLVHDIFLLITKRQREISKYVSNLKKLFFSSYFSMS